jgi:hypothetical protein
VVFLNDIDEVTHIDSVSVQNLGLLEHVYQVCNSEGTVSLERVLSLAAPEILKNCLQLGVFVHDSL